MIWLILIALFIVVPLLAGAFLHAGSGGSVPQPADGQLVKSRRPHLRTQARHVTTTTTVATPPTAQPVEHKS